MEELKQLYPLRGKISEVKDGQIRLNIGQMQGVKTGQRFRVIDEDVILEVTSTQKDASLAKLVQGKALLQAGSRVEALP